MISVIILTLNNDVLLFPVHFTDLLCIADYRNMKVLGKLRTNLCGITIDSLTAGDDQVIIKASYSACQSLGGSPGICTAEYTVGNQNAIVCAHSKSFTKNFISLRKTHGNNGNFCAVLILQAKSCLKSCLVIRVHDSEHCASVKSAVRVEFNSAFGIRNLFNANYNFHGIFTPYLLFSD